MLQLAEVLSVSLAVLVFGQAFLVFGFYIALARFRRTLLPDERCPRAAVVLCLRGSDPFLARCLQAVLAQDYPSFELRVVVDHPDDPANAVVQLALQQRPHTDAVILTLAEPRATCSLKCSSLIQAIATCDDSVAIVAQLDADTIPHRTWLRELATALADDRVGAATGNRWYMPEHASWGALVRYAWNAAAIVQMYWYRIAWGGTLAIKTAVIRDVRLLDRWGQAFCEDTMLFRMLSEHGWQVKFVPSLMMINRETCDLRGFRHWVQRQLLTARLYHPRWPAVAAHGLGTMLLLAVTAIALAASLAVGDVRAAGLLVISVISYQLSMFCLLWPMEWLVRRIARSRKEPTNWLTIASFFQLVGAIGLTQFVYPWALAMAMTLRRVDWRGVTYRIDGPWDIRLVEYRPYEIAAEPVTAVSL